MQNLHAICNTKQIYRFFIKNLTIISTTGMKIEQVFQLIIPVIFNIYNIRMKYRKKQTILIS